MMRRVPLAAALVLLGVSGCQPADTGQSEEPAAEEAAARTEAESSEPYVVEYAARDYVFVGPSEIPSGWVTLRMANEGMEHHFVFLTLLPEGKTMEDYVSGVGTAFDNAWHQLQSGAVDKAGAGAMLGEQLPAWYAEAASMGGPGLVSPGRTGQATMRLVPGDYVMECYVKTADGVFHMALGMAMPLTVTAEDSGASPPTPDLEITLSNHVIDVEGTPRVGEQTVAVHFEEHPEYGLGNDVHVVRLEEGTDLDEVVQWMDWMNVQGMGEPAPAMFVGGIHEMPAGYTAFFTVDLEPGRYAWIAESGAALGMVEQFSVE